MKKVLLINPAYPTTFWSFEYALKFIRKKAAYPPLGLLTVAAMLPNEWSLRLVDMNIEPLTDRDLARADMAWIGGMTIQKSSAVEVIQRCRTAGLKIVAGGPLFTVEPEAFPQVDHLILNEAEITLPPFLDDLATGRAKSIYRSDQFPDLQQTPIPAWDLVKMENYAALSIQFTRGCPFDCDFCNVTVLLGRRPRLKSTAKIIAELDTLYAAGWRGNIFFVDDNFIGNKGYLKRELLPEMIQWRQNKQGCVFFTETTINLADDPELMDLMVQAGFDTVFIGIESPDEASLAECRKTQNKNRNLLDNIRTIQRSGLQVQGGFIVGFDNDTPLSFQPMVDFIQQSGIVTAMVGVLQAPPGTRLFERLKQENRLAGNLSGDNVDGSTNIVPKMGMDTLTKGYQWIMAHLYEPEHFYRRVKTFLKEFKAPKVQVPMDGQRLLAFLRSALQLGIAGKERVQFWGLIFWTLLFRPKLLPLAVTFAIQGYHYRKICELHIY